MKRNFYLRPGALFVLIIGLALAGISAMVVKAESPARQILGEWEEVAWEYEIADTPADTTPIRVFGAVTCDLVRSAPVVHKFESWTFSSDGTICLSVAGHSTLAQWRLRGRGHILEIDMGGRKEHYSIMGLTDDKLVINYDTDLEVRGIAKLTFVKKGKRNDL